MPGIGRDLLDLPFAELVRRVQAGEAKARPDMVTDQTSAHDPLNGYVPNGMTLSEAHDLRTRNPEEYVARSVTALAGRVDRPKE